MLLKKKLKLKEVSAMAADKDKIKSDKKAEIANLDNELKRLLEILEGLKNDVKKNQELNDDLKKKLEELLAIKDKLKEQAYLMPHDFDQVKEKLEALKNEIKDL